ncbi:MAG: hypothetical protein Q9210_001206 [Variospora velana]
MDYDKRFPKSPASEEKHSATTDKKILSANESGSEHIITTAADGTCMTIIDPAAERALTRANKSNLGNAKTAGLEKTLKLKDGQYNTILSVFFVPYMLTAPLLGIAGKKYGRS